MKSTLRLALAQINPTVGNLSENAAKIKDHIRRANDLDSNIVLFPEMSLTGYPPEDLLLQPHFIEDTRTHLTHLSKITPKNIVSIVGFPEKENNQIYNSAAVLSSGTIQAIYKKQILPNYGVFDEKRYFSAGSKDLVLRIKNSLVGITICEDIWVQKGPAWTQSQQGASLILNLSASPFHAGKTSERLQLLKNKSKECHTAYEVKFASTPIIRAEYKLTRTTFLQYGIQWHREFDWMLKPESGLRRVNTFQVYSSDMVSGYNLVLLLGFSHINHDYDIHDYHPIFETGSPQDLSDFRFFIKAYAGM